MELKITLRDDGVLEVTGPINDKILSYGMLEMAKTVIQNIKNENKIMPVPPGAKIVEIGKH